MGLAKDAGYSAGHSDALASTATNPMPNTDEGCAFNITFSTAPNTQYLEGYRAAWITACKTTYNVEYVAAYQNGYNETIAATPEEFTTASTSEVQDPQANTKDSLSQLVIGLTLLVFVVGSVVILRRG